MTETKNINVGITIGDINGVGPEIILKSLYDRRILTSITPIIYGSDKVLNHYKKKVGLDDVNIINVKDASSAKKNQLNVINVCTEPVDIQEGKESVSAGKIAVLGLEKAAKDISVGEIDVIVTAPISKWRLKSFL